MARLQLTGTIQGTWLDSDVLAVFLGTEDAADLASSTPTGGTLVRTLTVADARDASAPTRYKIELDYAPTIGGKCATLPIGLACRDARGNASATDEGVVQLRDPPLGVARPTAAATENPNEATIEWALSPDVN